MIRQLKIVARLSSEDEAALATLPMTSVSKSSGEDIVREGDQPDSCCFVLSGLFCRYKLVDSGRRQIMSFNFPGDLPDLQSLYLERMDHGLMTLSPAVAAFIPHDAVYRLIDAYPGVRYALTKHILVDSSILRQWLANLGRRSALERIAHLFCECYVRLKARGFVPGQTFEFLPTQVDIGDATGLSSVHVNRTMQELRQRGLLKSSGRTQEILDFEGLKALADFDPAYLHMLQTR